MPDALVVGWIQGLLSTVVGNMLFNNDSLCKVVTGCGSVRSWHTFLEKFLYIRSTVEGNSQLCVV